MTKEEIKVKLRESGVAFDEDDNYSDLQALLKASSTATIEEPEGAATTATHAEPKVPAPEETGVALLLEKIKALEAKDLEKDKQLKMLYEVADKGRVQNYESQRAEKKPFKVKLSVFDGKTMVGWQIKRDELIKDPRTGTTVGEKQEIEAKLLDAAGEISVVTFDGYVSFSNARYSERIEAEVVNRKEDYNGNSSFDVRLPSGRIITLDARFVN